MLPAPPANRVDRVAKATPDGYTLGLLSQGQIAINPSLYKLPYDPVKDFAPVSQVTVSMSILVVHNAVPAKSVQGVGCLGQSATRRARVRLRRQR